MKVVRGRIFTQNMHSSGHHFDQIRRKGLLFRRPNPLEVRFSRSLTFESAKTAIVHFWFPQNNLIFELFRVYLPQWTNFPQKIIFIFDGHARALFLCRTPFGSENSTKNGLKCENGFGNVRTPFRSNLT